MYLVPPAAAASQLLLTCLKSQREGRHHPGTSAFSVGAEAGGGSRTVTPLTPVLSMEMVWPGRRGRASAKKQSLAGCTPDPCRAPPSLRGCLLLLPALWEWGATRPQCLRLAPGHGVSRAGLAPPLHPTTSTLPHLSSHPLEMPRLTAHRAARKPKEKRGVKSQGSVRRCPLCSILREEPTSAPNETPDAAAQEEQEP